MANLKPLVRSIIVCDDILVDPGNLNKATLVGVVNTIRALREPYFPLVHPMLCVFVQLVECRMAGLGRILVVHADGDAAFGSRDRPIPAGPDPLTVIGVRFRIRNCRFPRPGLYWVQFQFDGETLAECPLVLRGGPK